MTSIKRTSGIAPFTSIGKKGWLLADQFRKRFLGCGRATEMDHYSFAAQMKVSKAGIINLGGPLVLWHSTLMRECPDKMIIVQADVGTEKILRIKKKNGQEIISPFWVDYGVGLLTKKGRFNQIWYAPVPENREINFYGTRITFSKMIKPGSVYTIEVVDNQLQLRHCPKRSMPNHTLAEEVKGDPILFIGSNINVEHVRRYSGWLPFNLTKRKDIVISNPGQMRRTVPANFVKETGLSQSSRIWGNCEGGEIVAFRANNQEFTFSVARGADNEVLATSTVSFAGKPSLAKLAADRGGGLLTVEKKRLLFSGSAGTVGIKNQNSGMLFLGFYQKTKAIEFLKQIISYVADYDSNRILYWTPKERFPQTDLALIPAIYARQLEPKKYEEEREKAVQNGNDKEAAKFIRRGKDALISGKLKLYPTEELKNAEAFYLLALISFPYDQESPGIYFNAVIKSLLETRRQILIAEMIKTHIPNAFRKLTRIIGQQHINVTLQIIELKKHFSNLETNDLVAAMIVLHFGTAGKWHGYMSSFRSIVEKSNEIFLDLPPEKVRNAILFLSDMHNGLAVIRGFMFIAENSWLPSMAHAFSPVIKGGLVGSTGQLIEQLSASGEYKKIKVLAGYLQAESRFKREKKRSLKFGKGPLNLKNIAVTIRGYKLAGYLKWMIDNNISASFAARLLLRASNQRIKVIIKYMFRYDYLRGTIDKILDAWPKKERPRLAKIFESELELTRRIKSKRIKQYILSKI
ncbi:MAG: hypothetical protein HQ564_09780 [Candidatus Saganbacteria bacterium]|nr:hypothetical protein [Candidatus Saganbacteria bacterium]